MLAKALLILILLILKSFSSSLLLLLLLLLYQTPVTLLPNLLQSVQERLQEPQACLKTIHRWKDQAVREAPACLHLDGGRERSEFMHLLFTSQSLRLQELALLLFGIIVFPSLALFPLYSLPTCYLFHMMMPPHKCGVPAWEDCLLILCPSAVYAWPDQYRAAGGGATQVWIDLQVTSCTVPKGAATELRLHSGGT